MARFNRFLPPFLVFPLSAVGGFRFDRDEEPDSTTDHIRGDRHGLDSDQIWRPRRLGAVMTNTVTDDATLGGSTRAGWVIP